QVHCSRTTNSHCFQGLQKGHKYSFQVRALNNEGVGPWSEPGESGWTLTECPGQPLHPTLTQGSDPGPTSLPISIMLPEEDGGDPITAVVLEIREHGGTTVPFWEQSGCHNVSPGAHELEVVVRDLKPKTYYSFRTTAVNRNGSGEPGPPCRRLRTTMPLAPSTVPPPRVANSAPRSCVVTWKEPLCNGAPLEYYEVEGARLTVLREGIGGIFTSGDEGNDCGQDFWSITQQVRQSEVAKVTDKVMHKGDDIGSSGDSGCSEVNASGRGGSDSFEVAVSDPLSADQGGIDMVKKERNSSGMVGESHSILEVDKCRVSGNIHWVIMKNLVRQGQYAFRVSAANAVGLGKAGPWSNVVQLPDPDKWDPS
ncbi:unnamed protein product, partial [Choristocarpus tenellus]